MRAFSLVTFQFSNQNFPVHVRQWFIWKCVTHQWIVITHVIVFNITTRTKCIPIEVIYWSIYLSLKSTLIWFPVNPIRSTWMLSDLFQFEKESILNLRFNLLYLHLHIQFGSGSWNIDLVSFHCRMNIKQWFGTFFDLNNKMVVVDEFHLDSNFSDSDNTKRFIQVYFYKPSDTLKIFQVFKLIVDSKIIPFGIFVCRLKTTISMIINGRKQTIVFNSLIAKSIFARQWRYLYLFFRQVSIVLMPCVR